MAKSPTPRRMLLELDDDWTAPSYEGPTSVRRFKDSIHDYRVYLAFYHLAGDASRTRRADFGCRSAFWADCMRHHRYVRLYPASSDASTDRARILLQPAVPTSSEHQAARDVLLRLAWRVS